MVCWAGEIIRVCFAGRVCSHLTWHLRALWWNRSSVWRNRHCTVLTWSSVSCHKLYARLEKRWARGEVGGWVISEPEHVSRGEVGGEGSQWTRTCEQGERNGEQGEVSGEGSQWTGTCEQGETKGEQGGGGWVRGEGNQWTGTCEQGCVCVYLRGGGNQWTKAHIYAKTSMTQTTDICDPHYLHKSFHDLYMTGSHKTIHGPHKSFHDLHNRHPWSTQQTSVIHTTDIRDPHRHQQSAWSIPWSHEIIPDPHKNCWFTLKPSLIHTRIADSH